jgi:LuxR family maltose regulon positive regulatory protein
MGEIEKAREAMHLVELCIQEQVFTPLRSAALHCGLVRLWILLGDLDRGEDWMGNYGVPAWDGSEGAPLSPMQAPWHLTRLRLSLARGDYAFACKLSEWLLRNLAETKYTAWRIETLLLQALAFQGVKETDRALSALKDAFSLAQPGGYRRIFLDEGEPMAKLLYQAKARRLASGYAEELLLAAGYAQRDGLPGGVNLIEALTPRELEVLKLIEAGCSNQEIAANLVISLPTVKRHISNIYSKLGASSRTQALARGRELNLFQ